VCSSPLPSINQSTLCVPCSPGYESSSGGQQTSCITCAAGKYKGEDDNDCVQCPPGTESKVVGATVSVVCLACSVGKYNPQPGSTCRPCPPSMSCPPYSTNPIPYVNLSGYRRLQVPALQPASKLRVIPASVWYSSGHSLPPPLAFLPLVARMPPHDIGFNTTSHTCAPNWMLFSNGPDGGVFFGCCRNTVVHQEAVVGV
jgi:hypothetical protein